MIKLSLKNKIKRPIAFIGVVGFVGFFGLSLSILYFTVMGCSDSHLPKYWQLGDLRILALIADVPEIQSPENQSIAGVVNLTPIVSDLNGGGRSLSLKVEACVDPGVAYGADPDCGINGTTVHSSTITPVPTTANSGLFGSPDYTGALNSIAITVPVGVLAGQPAPAQYNGVAYLAVVTVSSQDGSGNGSATTKAFKRILISNKAVINKNPDIKQMLVNGVAPNLAPNLSPGAEVGLPFDTPAQLSLNWEGAAKESYQRMKKDLSFEDNQEVLTTTWFVSDGSLQWSRTEEGGSTQWTTPKANPPGRHLVLVAILRDNRGGASVKITAIDKLP